MFANSIEQLDNLIMKDEESITFSAYINYITKIQLFLTGRINKGVEIFGIGALEINRLFLVEHMTIINKAVSCGYRVFVRREGEYFSKGNWYLEFLKEMNDSVSE